ncbi:MAG: hypothetical protein VX725_02025, partial [Actinomycetota bacterium]|nr:hypothetical protein [Actinomycetota bacterium]
MSEPGKSPGVSTREIDLTAPTKVVPKGIPAGIIGTAVRGPAFVPVTFATFKDFGAAFGSIDGKQFGPLAVSEWMKNSSAGTYIRLLGAGDGKLRDSVDGAVTNAGFTVGQELVQADGLIGQNPDTEIDSTSGASGSLGRTYFLGCFMSESAGTSTFSSAGIQTSGENIAYPIIRGVLFAASGVVPSLSSSEVPNNQPVAVKGGTIFGVGTNAGANLGDVVTGSAKQEFVMILNGHKISDTSKNVLTASFDPAAANYFGNMFNTDPVLIEDQGHYLYTRYDIDPVYAEITGSGVGPTGGMTDHKLDRSTLGFLLTSSMARGTSAATTADNVGVPDFESFTDRFGSAVSPYVVSQRFGGRNGDLFRIHSRDDGVVGNSAIKVTIENVAASSNDAAPYGKFDLLVRKFDDSDADPFVLEAFRGLSLDPSSDKYITRIIGDTRSFFDFDKKAGSQKLVVEGKYPNTSQFIRIEESSDLRNKRVDKTALPTGFRGLPH